nr:site-specific DNA-methyltransferase [uncultured Dethiosulfovibrio sp.]
MEYKKVPQDINDFTNDNLKALSELFPSVIKDGHVDFKALKEELGQFEEVNGEKYELTWSGKQNAKRKAQEKVLGRTLNYIEEDSKNPDTTQNLYIEGDNLEVLKLLRQNYYGSVKMIYIDPPYNTGNDFVYNDNFKMNAKESDIAEGLVSEDGERLQKNLKSTNRYHANWLNMMYPRLKVARDLLTDDGVIFISIDDEENANLIKLCEDIFGEGNFQANVSWQKRYTRSNNTIDFTTVIEHVLVYSKSREFIVNLLPRSEEADARYSNPDSDERGVWKGASFLNPATPSQRPNLCYPIKNPISGQITNPTTNAWRRSKEEFDRLTQDNRLYWGKDGTQPIPAIKMFLSEARGLTPTNFWGHEYAGNTDLGTFEIQDLMNEKIFNNPKPSKLICRCVEHGTSKNDIILDFFSGSATTAHAVMQLNAEDGGSRRFIMVQLPEMCDEDSEAYKAGFKNICEIGKERIRRAGERIKEEIEGENGQLKLGEDPKKVPDIGFKVFRTSDTNIRWNLVESDHRQLDLDAIKDNPDVMDFTSNAKDVDVVYEIMLRQKDVPLSESMETLSHIGNRTYLYGSSYLICLETEVTEGMVDKLAAIDPLPIKFVFRDSAFKDDISLKDETFRRLEGLIAKNSGDVKKTYTVEFI